MHLFRLRVCIWSLSFFLLLSTCFGGTFVQPPIFAQVNNVNAAASESRVYAFFAFVFRTTVYIIYQDKLSERKR